MDKKHGNKCPVCGAPLIWDYELGEVICSSCGLVVDRIYDYRPLMEDENQVIWNMIKTSRNPRRNHISRKYRFHMKLYYKVNSYVKDKPWLEIDYEKVFETGKMINTLKSRATIEAEKKISDRKLWRHVREGIRYIEKIYPVALARSGRGKYALAYMVSTYLNNKKFPDMNEVIETFNISETSYRRLLKIAREIVSLEKTVIVK